MQEHTSCDKLLMLGCAVLLPPPMMMMWASMPKLMMHNSGIMLCCALPVCQALGKIPGRERDVLLHHMQYFYGTSPNVNRQYSPKDWGTWARSMISCNSQICVDSRATETPCFGHSLPY
eukprot:1156108-Pelagomonas_calceolata.AAC.3